jgi:glycerophosphoryl diester phosphodiesterase
MHAPENTIPSIAQAIEHGADAVEIDVHLSADGEVVVIHDSTVDRTTDGSGPVAGLRFAELRELDAGARFSPDRGLSNPYRGQSIRVPSLAEILGIFPETHFVVELKAAAAQEAALRVVNEMQAGNRIVLASFDLGAVRLLRKAGLPTGGSVSELRLLFLQSILGLSPGRLDYGAMFLPRRHGGLPLPLSPFLRAADRGSVAVHTWVENDPDAATRLWLRGVSGVVTDDPAALVKARSAAGLPVGGT